jgi:hypothetical protein
MPRVGFEPLAFTPCVLADSSFNEGFNVSDYTMSSDGMMKMNRKRYGNVVKIKLSLHLNKRYSTKKYDGEDVKIHVLLTSAMPEGRGLIYANGRLGELQSRRGQREDKYLALSALELQPLSHPASNQSLCQLRYAVSYSDISSPNLRQFCSAERMWIPCNVMLRL